MATEDQSPAEIAAQVGRTEIGDDIEATGDDIVAQVKGSRRDMRRLGDGLTELARATATNADAVVANSKALTRSRTIEIILGLACVLALIACVLGALALRGQSRQTRCLQQYATTNALRNLVLTDGRKDLDAANSQILLDAFNPGTLTQSQQRARLIADGKRYTEAANDYKRLLAAHPVPPPPKIDHC